MLSNVSSVACRLSKTSFPTLLCPPSMDDSPNNSSTVGAARGTSSGFGWRGGAGGLVDIDSPARGREDRSLGGPRDVSARTPPSLLFCPGRRFSLPLSDRAPPCAPLSDLCAFSVRGFLSFPSSFCFLLEACERGALFCCGSRIVCSIEYVSDVGADERWSLIGRQAFPDGRDCGFVFSLLLPWNSLWSDYSVINTPSDKQDPLTELTHVRDVVFWRDFQQQPLHS